MARLTFSSLAFVLALATLATAFAPPAVAQYFGRNKVQYENFDFRVLRTEHFDIHYYPESEEGVRDAARMAERWYTRLSSILGHEFDRRMPIILYADDADFRQTNAVGGQIGEGVQGVTEGFKLRVVMPLTGSYEETDHVLGHELIHQFQYDISQRGAQFANFVRLPLWLIEGMAEYFSVGRQDANTAMWLRDAIIRDAFPSLEQLSRDPRYFPYRYGQAFWAWVGGTYGDEAAVQLFRAALAMPIDSAIVSVTGITADSLSVRWRNEVADAYLPLVRGRTAPPYQGYDLAQVDQARLDSLGLLPLPGRRVLARDIDAGNTNIAPQLSPDGRYVAFLSERDLFGIDLFLADAQTGQVIKRLQSVGSDPHLDALRFLDSAGTWSPDGEKFAFVTFVQGSNEIAILDVASREIERRIQVTGVGAIKDPSWSPDGRRLAFMGIRGGISDLYVVDIGGGQARQLTSDRHLALQPTWSPDGRFLAFATDRGPETSFERLVYSQPRIALYDFEENAVEVLPVFGNAKHINPQFSPDGESLYFISNRGGISNVYRLHRPSGEVFQVTDVATGVSGITDKAPALTVASQTGLMMYSVFEAQNYSVYALDPGEAQGTRISGAVAGGPAFPAPTGPLRVTPEPLPEPIPQDPSQAESPLPGDTLEVDPQEVPAEADPAEADAPAVVEAPAEAPGQTPRAVATGPEADAEAAALGVLPPLPAVARSRVENYLAAAQVGLPSSEAEFPDRAYRPRLVLDYISQPTVGVGYESYYGGMGVGGGIAFRFSDMLGDHVLGVVVQAQGTLKDIGGQVAYLNQRNRLNWGATVTHIPYLQVFISGVQRPDGGFGFARFYQRTYISQLSGVAAYPLSQTRRFEGSAGLMRYGYELEVDVIDQSGRFRRQPAERVFPNLQLPDALYLAQAGTAFVGDYSFFGFTSPVRGGRYRFGVDGTAGSLTFATATADYRRYLFTRPFFTFAARALHYGRYGPDANSGQLNPLYLGYGTIVRGYSFGSFETNEAFNATAPKLYGSRMAVGNVEVRMPLFGTREFGLFNFPYLPTELVLFADAGFVWGQFDGSQNPAAPNNMFGRSFEDAWQDPVLSAGASARVNLLGALVLEFYYARPFSRDDVRAGVFGVNFSPGW